MLLGKISFQIINIPTSSTYLLIIRERHVYTVLCEYYNVFPIILPFLELHTYNIEEKKTYISFFSFVVVLANAAGTIQGSEVHSNYKWSVRVQISRDSTTTSEKKENKKTGV